MTSTVSSAEPLVQGAFFKPCELSAPFNWQPGLLRKLDELRCMGQFCDVTIQVDDTIGDASFLPYMRVHSVIVAAGSPMLHEKLQDPSFAGSVLVAGVGVWQWEQVINFLYTGKVCLTASGQAEALVQAAIELKMEVLVNMLQDHLGPSDAAAVEDVKPLKSRQAADTSEPMDDDDEDNDAGAAPICDEDDDVKPLPVEQNMPPSSSGKNASSSSGKNTPSKRGRKRKKRALYDDDFLSIVKDQIQNQTKTMENVEVIQTRNISGAKLTSSMKKSPRTRNSKPNYRIDESEKEEEEDDDDDVLYLPSDCDETETSPKKSRKNDSSRDLSENYDQAEDNSGHEITSPDKTDRSKKGKRKQFRMCEVCGKGFSYEKSFLQHNCQSPKVKKEKVKDPNYQAVEGLGKKGTRSKRRTCDKCKLVFFYEKPFLKHTCMERVPSLENDYCDEVEQNVSAKEVIKMRRRKRVINKTCELCTKHFKYERAYLSHICQQQETKCHRCKNNFPNETKFLEHKCISLPTDKALNVNIEQSAEGEQTVEGDQAENGSPHELEDSTAGAKRERRNRGERIIQRNCESCQKIFWYEKSFLKHRCKKKPPAAEKLKEYEDHQCKESGIFDLPIPKSECTMCGEKFDEYKLLVAHSKEKHDVEISTNAPQPDIRCPFCAFKKPYQQLVPHIWSDHGYRVRTPKGIPPLSSFYKCKHCGYRCLHYFRIHEHVSEVHAEIPPSFMCDTCGKCYKRKSRLVEHMLLHNDIPPLQCQYCSRTFRSSTSKGRHELLHVGYKPYTCNLCGMKFTQTISCSLHLQKHHPQVPKDQYKEARTYTPLKDANIDPNQVRQLQMRERKTKRKCRAMSPDSNESFSEDDTYPPNEDGTPTTFINIYPDTHTNTHPGQSREVTVMCPQQQYEAFMQGQYATHLTQAAAAVLNHTVHNNTYAEQMRDDFL